MSKKILFVCLTIVLFFTIVVCFRFMFGGSEDGWLCENNIWVKHGNPSTAAPVSGCGAEKPVSSTEKETPDLPLPPVPDDFPATGSDITTGTDSLIVTSFQECVDAGNDILKSNPRQCRAGNEIFTEDPINIVDKSNLIILDSPRAEETGIASPLVVRGKARGNWFFEASFPVILTNWDGLIISEGIATAEGDWMTEEFVPFEATLEFTADTTVSKRGSLILQKDNPSGLPQYDDALEITVFFQ